MRGSTVARKVDLKEKRVHAPNPMTQEPFFSLHVVATPTIPEIVVPTPGAPPHMATMSEGPELSVRSRLNPLLHMKGNCSSHLQKMCHMKKHRTCQKLRPIEDLKELKSQPFLKIRL